MHSNLVSRVAGNIKDIVKTGDRLVVGLSGGVDSVVLLDVLARLARRRRVRLSAIYVNHQLSPNASRWAAFCRKVCEARGVPLRVVKVTVRRGNSLEAAARAARYDAFHRLRAEHVALAHNQDDQAETLLLQLLRGAGVKGLAAMPLVRREAGGERREAKIKFQSAARRTPHASHLTPFVIRPLLDVPRSEIERYARQRKLAWIEDESNIDSYFLRNFLRREVLPVIAQRVPAYRATLARSARNFAEAAQLLDDLALADGEAYVKNGVLDVSGLRRMSRARGRNLLRWFLGGRGVPMPNADRLDEALRQARMAKDDARVCIDLGDHQLRRFAGALYLVAKTAPVPAGFSRRWLGERKLVLMELNGVLTMEKRRGNGISLARIGTKPATIRTRRGGERLQPDCGRPRRSLKNLLQESRIPPWERDRLPLLFCSGDLVWAPGIGIACKYQAKEGEPSVIPGWTAAAPSG